MNEERYFCCEGIRILRGDYPINGKYSSPLDFTPQVEYGLNGRVVWFCPSCGKKFKNHTTPDDDRPCNPDFCCGSMEHYANLPDHHDWFEIFYQPWIRRYFFSNTEDPRDGRDKGKVYLEWDFYYCLFCGQKLPECLLKEWLGLLEKEFAIPKETPMKEILEKLPKKFRTEEWWSGHSHRPKIIEQDPSDKFPIISTHGRWWDKNGCEDCL